jgi:hypothetical protein
MANVRVWILYEPLIYADLFHWIFERIGMVEVMRAANPGEKLTDRESFQGERIEVIILPLDDQGQPRLDILPDPPSGAKYLAFSPDGKKGFRRLPGASSWQEVSPFNLEKLIVEVFDQFDSTIPECIMPASRIG